MTDEHQWDIEELLHRRTDLSTFVTHWTRDTDGASAADNLKNILETRRISARTPMGAGTYELKRLAALGKLKENALEEGLRSQRVVCFTEAPLEQAWSFVCSISGRSVRLEPYGIAFTKEEARSMGVNPVWYVDMTPGHDWLTKDIDSLVRRAAEFGDFSDDPIARLAPFMEGMGTWEGKTRKEFWWEREWRHLGDFQFSEFRCAVVFCPEPEFEAVKPLVTSPGGRSVPLIDPTWGLEHIIKSLSGVPPP